MKKMQYARRMLAALIAFVITITNVQPLLASTVIDGENKKIELRKQWLTCSIFYFSFQLMI